MLARFFRSASPQIFVALLVSMLLLRLSGLWSALVSVSDFESFPWLGWLISLFVLAFSAWQLNRVVERHDMVKPLNYLVALNLIILVSANPELLNFRYEFIALPFLIGTLDVILDLPKTNNVLASVYNGGFYIGVASLLVPAAVLVVLPLFIGVILFRAPQWRNYVVPFFGLFTPWLLWLTWQYWEGREASLGMMEWLKGSFDHFSMTNASGVLLGLIILALPLFLRYLSTNTIRNRRGLSVVLTFAAIFILPFYFGSRSNTYLVLMSIGIAPLLAYFQMHARRSWVREIHLLALILWALLGQFDLWS